MSIQEDIELAFTGAYVPQIEERLQEVLNLVESGEIRAAVKTDAGWVTHEWVKKALILLFKHLPTETYHDGVSAYYDRVPSRFHEADAATFQGLGVRLAPGAVVRRGAYIGKDAVLLPSFINVGAYVGEGTMIDT